MMDITDLRKEIDAVDAQLAALLTERMDISKRIAVWKKENGRPALDTRREREKLAALTSAAREDMAQPLRVVYSLLFELSRAEQNTLLQPESQQLQMIRKAIAETPQLFPERAHVACQGVEGAYSTAACEKLFRAPEITYLKSFEGVFSAISSGLCDYGVLPIENSTAGSVKQVYDLLIANNCYIVRAARIKINHALLACPGATVDSIREIYSHEQALSQCQSHLEQLPNAMLHACSNTAAAAQMVALWPALPDPGHAGQRQQPHPVHLHRPPAGDLPRHQQDDADAHGAPPARRPVQGAGAAVLPGAERPEAGEPAHSQPGF